MNKHDPIIPDASLRLETADCYWQEKADEYQRLGEENKDNPQRAAAFARLSDAYSAAAAEMQAREVAKVTALKAGSPSKLRTRASR
jgi:hypothetical protein